MPTTVEEKTGKIENFYDNDSGVIREDGTGELLDFYHPGASVEFVKGDSVIYLKVKTPSGNIIVRGIRKPN
ncbi:MAG: hypothetical protein KatS3mg027_0849 [Bacteroidia bacterium]|nr:MAG: hypothetical protein KatS3mg027_0849 [Bacteroidia bacterium]